MDKQNLEPNAVLLSACHLRLGSFWFIPYIVGLLAQTGCKACVAAAGAALAMWTKLFQLVANSSAVTAVREIQQYTTTKQSAAPERPPDNSPADRFAVPYLLVDFITKLLGVCSYPSALHSVSDTTYRSLHR